MFLWLIGIFHHLLYIQELMFRRFFYLLMLNRELIHRIVSPEKQNSIWYIVRFLISIEFTFNQYHVVKYWQFHLRNKFFWMNSSILSQLVDQQQINDDRVRSINCSRGRFSISVKFDHWYGCFRRTLLFIHGGSRTMKEYLLPSFSKKKTMTTKSNNSYRRFFFLPSTSNVIFFISDQRNRHLAGRTISPPTAVSIIFGCSFSCVYSTLLWIPNFDARRK